LEQDWILQGYAKAPGWGDCEVAAERRESGNWIPTVPRQLLLVGFEVQTKTSVDLGAWRWTHRCMIDEEAALPH
jgi:hypothetical protein